MNWCCRAGARAKHATVDQRLLHLSTTVGQRCAVQYPLGGGRNDDVDIDHARDGAQQTELIRRGDHSDAIIGSVSLKQDGNIRCFKQASYFDGIKGGLCSAIIPAGNAAALSPNSSITVSGWRGSA